MVNTLAGYVGERVTKRAPEAWHWRGRPVRLVDGTTVTLPDTAANQAAYPQSRNQKPVICQDSCHVIQAASFTTLFSCRTGLSQTVAGRSQLRVEPRQRSGLAALASS